MSHILERIRIFWNASGFFGTHPDFLERAGRAGQSRFHVRPPLPWRGVETHVLPGKSWGGSKSLKFDKNLKLFGGKLGGGGGVENSLILRDLFIPALPQQLDPVIRAISSSRALKRNFYFSRELQSSTLPLRSKKSGCRTFWNASGFFGTHPDFF